MFKKGIRKSVINIGFVQIKRKKEDDFQCEFRRNGMGILGNVIALQYFQKPVTDFEEKLLTWFWFLGWMREWDWAV
jgi:hypothetical protein